VNDVVEFELIDLTRIKLDKASTDMLEQSPQLLFVIIGDQLSSGAALCLLGRPAFRTPWLSHDSNLRPSRPARSRAVRGSASYRGVPSQCEMSVGARLLCPPYRGTSAEPLPQVLVQLEQAEGAAHN